ncbi:hypothetical protein [Hyphomicrobium sp.]|uniref:hypothetical protein n=1 Tax=Hyphomicrobium sp. TaxID=82 RepID=UPI003F71DD37
MTFMTRAVTAFAVLTTAAIPVGALTVKNTSSNEVSIAVDNGASEGVYQIPAGGSVDVKEDCVSDCAVTGPWGFSRLVSQNATIETDGMSMVTAGAAPSATAPAPAAAAPAAAPQSLVPQNPVDEAPAPPATEPTAKTAAEPAPAAAPQKPRRATQPRKQAKPAPKGPGSGSFEMLFQGPGK